MAVFIYCHEFYNQMNRFAFLFSTLLFGLVFYDISIPFTQVEAIEKQESDTTIIFLKDYGLEKTRKKDCTAILNKALKEINTNVPTIIKFNRGEYHFFPGESTKRNYYESNNSEVNPVNCALLFENQKNLIIDGNGSTLIFHDQIQPFTFDNCRNIILKNVNIDWDQPLTAQGKVVKVNDNFIELAVDLKESPCTVDEDGILYFTYNKRDREPWKNTIEFDREGRYIVPQTGDLGCLGKGWENYMAENIIPGVIKLNYSFLRKPTVGNYLVLQHNKTIQAGIFIQSSKNISVQNVNVYYAVGPSVEARFSEDLFFDNFKATPNEAKNRYFGGDGNGLQIINGKGQIKVNNCEFAGLMNSPVNIHGTGIQIVEKTSDNQLKCRLLHPFSGQFNWAHSGDSIRFIKSSTLQTLGIGIIENVKTNDASTISIVFKDKIPSAIENKDILENLTWKSNVSITNSLFKSSRGNSIQLLTSGKVVIKNNVFESSGSAIVIAGDTNSRLETGSVTDVLIENNEFTDLCNTSSYQFSEGIISIYPEIPALNENTPQYQRNIRIINNRFNPFDYTILFARSVDGLTFENNTVTHSIRFEPFQLHKNIFSFEACKKISINNNTFSDDILGKNIVLKWIPETELNCMQPELTIKMIKMAE